MQLDIQLAAEFLQKKHRVLILTHKNPDGDTLGSGYALCHALQIAGKQACVKNADALPKKFDYMYGTVQQSFDPDAVVAVDIADTQLLGSSLQGYADTIDLCIDHHVSHVPYAKHTLLDSTASATAEIIFKLVRQLEIPFDVTISDCLYTGIVTDTGCFKFSNTTAQTHRIAADLIELGARYEWINRELFENKSRARIALERVVLDAMEFHFDGRCSLIVVTREMMRETGADHTTFDGISAITRQIEGVEVGITLREIGEQNYKISLRTSAAVNAALLCQQFGGGGHVRAAGCTLTGEEAEVRQIMLDAVKKVLGV